MAVEGTISGNDEPYPTYLNVEKPAQQSRLTNLPLGIGWIIRAILLIPHFIVLYFLGIIAALVYLVATFGILFSGVYPPGMFALVNGYLRWTMNVTAYLYSLFDPYPPFTTDQKPYPLDYDTLHPAQSSRLLNFPFLGIFIRQILLIPHLIIVAFLGLAAIVVVFIAKFAILFTGVFPEGMHRFVVGYMRWYARINAYLFGLTDRYPPFSTN